MEFCSVGTRLKNFKLENNMLAMLLGLGEDGLSYQKMELVTVLQVNLIPVEVPHTLFTHKCRKEEGVIVFFKKEK